MRRISFSRAVGNHVEIFSANPDGSDIEQLTTSKPRGGVSFISDWSPDGQTIALSGRQKAPADVVVVIEAEPVAQAA